MSDLSARLPRRPARNLSSRPERSGASAVEGPALGGGLSIFAKQQVSRLHGMIRKANHSAPLEMTDEIRLRAVH